MSLAIAIRLVAAISLCAALAAPPAAAGEGSATTGSGGVLATPLQQGPGGGGLAPQGDWTTDASAAGAEPEAERGPVARPAQEETPTTPEGEEQPPQDGEPAPDGQPAPDEEGAPVTPPGEDIATDDGAIGLLPSTGLEAAALAAIGLGLLMAGAALRPRRRSV